MSRPSAAGFADFFPAAPRAAKNKAKERQRAKSKALDSPSLRPVTSDQEPNFALRSRDESGLAHRLADGVNGVVRDGAVTATDDNESLQGDLLNGVGSASSHTSTISSTFSAPPMAAIFGGSSNLNSLTPLTIADSSPPQLATSPQHSKTVTTVPITHDQLTDGHIPQHLVTQARPDSVSQILPAPRIYARDPNQSVKGEKCTYDPQLDPKLSSSDKKRAKPTYKVFGLVCT
jgi:[histone H3]-lysine4 N-trimethyltransferase SETD1